MVSDTRTTAAELAEQAAAIVEQDKSLGDVHGYNITNIGNDLRSIAARIRRLARRED
jgi:hypothetical protein